MVGDWKREKSLPFERIIMEPSKIFKNITITILGKNDRLESIVQISLGKNSQINGWIKKIKTQII